MLHPAKNSTGKTDGFQQLDSDDEQLTIYGYRRCLVRTTLTWIAAICTAGLLLLVFHWQPYFRLIATHKKCTLSKANKVLIREIYRKKCKKDYIQNIEFVQISSDSDEVVKVDDAVRKKNSVTIYFHDGSKKNFVSYLQFKHKKNYFVWADDNVGFKKMIGIEKATLCSDFYNFQGYSIEEQKTIQSVYGQNEIKIPVQTIGKLLILEVFNPFYIFQLFTIGVWLSENYFYYCIAIVIMSVFSITTSIIQTHRNQINLKDTVESSEMVQVCRDKMGSTIDTINSVDLVPGDIIIIPANGCTMQVDAVLLDGSCIVNESMLTGESVPMTKTAIPHKQRPYDIKDDSHHTLYCGTKVIQTRYYTNEYARAVVLRTGFQTTKGQLVRSILYPTPAFFKFDRDSYWFIVILTVIAFLGLIYTVAIKSGQSTTARDIVIKSLDILTIVIPPALPAAMTLGRLYAITRLRKLGIFCVNPKVINVCGSVTCVCFDKTGTLTEDGLDMWGVVPASFWCDQNKSKQTCSSQSLERVQKSPSSETEHEINEIKNIHNFIGHYLDVNYDGELQDDAEVIFSEPIKHPHTISNNNMFKVGLTVCHSLTILDGYLMGDPLEIKMFESTNWVLEEPTIPDTSKFELLAPTVVSPSSENNESDYSIMSQQWGIVCNYQFSSSLQRSSVICKSLSLDHYIAFTKGSPEMIKALSKPESIPNEFKSILKSYTHQGYRVLAMACKPLHHTSYHNIKKLTREEVECDLTFLGLIVLENRLKAETEPVIEELKDANIKVVMITGDNLDTAVSVASECGILQPEDKLIICDAVESDDNDSPPSLYFTSSIISVKGLRRSKVDQNQLPGHVINVDKSVSSNLYSHSSSEESLESGPGLKDKEFRIAMDGRTWQAMREYYPHLVKRVATRGVVFARMSSEQKQQLVQELQTLGYYVAMCGDGANDCGALKAAHVGISVSGDESSVASPFTSKDANITCVPHVIREGRAALTTSFGMFKFMISYSLAEFLSVAMLYYFSSNLTDFQFLFIDVVLILTVASLFGKTEAYAGKLYKIPPGTSLLSFVPIISLILQFLNILLLQVVSLFYIKSFPWYVPHKGVIATDYKCHDNYSIFTVSTFQYISLAIAYSRGYPYRKTMFTNIPFSINILFLIILCSYITAYPANWVSNVLELEVPPDINYRCTILGFALLNLLISLFFEKIIIEYLMQNKKILPENLRENPQKSYLHNSVEKEIQNERDWPQINSNTNPTTENKIENIKETKKAHPNGRGFFKRTSSNNS